MEPFHKILSYDEEHHSRHSVSAGKSDDIGNDLHTIWLFFTCKDRQFYAFPPLPNVKNGGENSFSPPFSFAVPLFLLIFALGLRTVVVHSVRASVNCSASLPGLFLCLQREESLLEGMRKPDNGGNREFHVWKAKNTGGSHSVNFDKLFGDVTVLKPTGCAAAFSVLGSRTDRHGLRTVQYATTDNNQIRPLG